LHAVPLPEQILGTLGQFPETTIVRGYICISFQTIQHGLPTRTCIQNGAPRCQSSQITPLKTTHGCCCKRLWCHALHRSTRKTVLSMTAIDHRSRIGRSVVRLRADDGRSLSYSHHFLPELRHQASFAGVQTTCCAKSGQDIGTFGTKYLTCSWYTPAWRNVVLHFEPHS